MLTLAYSTWLNADSTTGKQELVLATPAKADSFFTQWSGIAFRAALDKLGYELNITYCEPMRCTHLANSGRLDGELMRAAMYQDTAPNLIRLRESVMAVSWMAYSKDPDLRMSDWQDVIDSGKRVGIVYGVPHLEQQLQPIEGRLARVSHWRQGISMLQRGEIDVFIESPQAMADAEIPELHKAFFTTGPLDVLDLYLYLHKKHYRLALELSAVIENLKISGAIDAMYLEFLLARSRANETEHAEMLFN